MKKPPDEKSESEGGSAEDSDGPADFAGKVFGERANVGVGIGKVGEHGGYSALRPGSWSRGGLVESGGKLASSFRDSAGVELNLLSDRSEFCLD
jgi:hypothetical protein